MISQRKSGQKNSLNLLDKRKNVFTCERGNIEKVTFELFLDGIGLEPQRYIFTSHGPSGGIFMLLVSRTLAEFAKQQLTWQLWVTQELHNEDGAVGSRFATFRGWGGCTTQNSFSLCKVPQTNVPIMTDNVSSILVGLELLSKLLSTDKKFGPSLLVCLHDFHSYFSSAGHFSVTTLNLLTRLWAIKKQSERIFCPVSSSIKIKMEAASCQVPVNV